MDGGSAEVSLVTAESASLGSNPSSATSLPCDQIPLYQCPPSQTKCKGKVKIAHPCTWRLKPQLSWEKLKSPFFKVEQIGFYYYFLLAYINYTKELLCAISKCAYNVL
jgi:hypothetical protein